MEPAPFYFRRLQAFRIGESNSAPLFTIETDPSEEKTAGGEVKKEFDSRDKVRYQFFEQLLSNANQITNIFNSVLQVSYQT
ncbi:MAG: hypothetical protein SV062_13670 [Thermodesulfobacteriota bacterium]|nr:hypothetical protein [Thermodesulfobacteriota bacterium]